MEFGGQSQNEQDQGSLQRLVNIPFLSALTACIGCLSIALIRADGDNMAGSPNLVGMIDKKKTNNISLMTGAGHIDEQATHHHECHRRRSRRLPIYCISGAQRFERGEALIQGEPWREANNLRLEGYRQALIK